MWIIWHIYVPASEIRIFDSVFRICESGFHCLYLQTTIRESVSMDGEIYMISRLKKYMEYKRLLPSQFADNAAIPRSTFSQLTKSDNNNISSEIISKIHQAYPDLSIVWLLWGEGEMLSAPAGNSEAMSVQPELKFDDMVSAQQEPESVQPRPAEIPFDAVDTAVVPEVRPANPIYNRMRVEKAPQEKQPPRITKIIVFYDDNTFESFVNDKTDAISPK